MPLSLPKFPEFPEFPEFYVTAERGGVQQFVAETGVHWHNGYPDCPQRAPSVAERFINMVMNRPTQSRSLSFRIGNASDSTAKPPAAVSLRDVPRVAWFFMSPSIMACKKLRISTKPPAIRPD